MVDFNSAFQAAMGYYLEVDYPSVHRLIGAGIVGLVEPHHIGLEEDSRVNRGDARWILIELAD